MESLNEVLNRHYGQIGHALRITRVAKDVTNGTVARHLGVRREYISGVEHDNLPSAPSRDFFRKICRYYGVSCRGILALSTPPKGTYARQIKKLRLRASEDIVDVFFKSQS